HRLTRCLHTAPARTDIFTLSLHDALPISRTSLQCVCTRRRNCIEQWSPSPKYAPGTAPFPVGNTAIVKLTHYPRACRRPFCGQLDRKSTRLNSSHQIISYAVFCLKKKTNK